MGGLPKVAVNGAVLRWARESIRIPLDSAAERIGMSAEQLAALEADGGVFRYTELGRST